MIRKSLIIAIILVMIAEYTYHPMTDEDYIKSGVINYVPNGKTKEDYHKYIHPVDSSKVIPYKAIQVEVN